MNKMILKYRLNI